MNRQLLVALLFSVTSATVVRAQAYGVDLLGGEAGGRVVADPVLIERRAVR